MGGKTDGQLPIFLALAQYHVLLDGLGSSQLEAKPVLTGVEHDGRAGQSISDFLVVDEETYVTRVMTLGTGLRSTV